MLFRQNWYMPQMTAEQGLCWISQECLRFSSAFQKAFPGGPRRRRRAASIPRVLWEGSSWAAPSHQPAPSPHGRKGGQAKGSQPSPGAQGAPPCDFVGNRRAASLFPRLGCISAPAKTTAPQCHPSCRLRYGMLQPSSPPHGARTTTTSLLRLCHFPHTRSKDHPSIGPQELKTSKRLTEGWAPLLYVLCRICSWSRVENPRSPGTPRQGKQISPGVKFASGSLQQNCSVKEPFNAIKTT